MCKYIGKFVSKVCCLLPVQRIGQTLEANAIALFSSPVICDKTPAITVELASYASWTLACNFIFQSVVRILTISRPFESCLFCNNRLKEVDIVEELYMNLE